MGEESRRASPGVSNLGALYNRFFFSDCSVLHMVYGSSNGSGLCRQWTGAYGIERFRV